jgi:hypothetical protein
VAKPPDEQDDQTKGAIADRRFRAAKPTVPAEAAARDRSNKSPANPDFRVPTIAAKQQNTRQRRDRHPAPPAHSYGGRRDSASKIIMVRIMYA